MGKDLRHNVHDAPKDERKDRHSGDAKSSVEQPPKKQGHGGKFTWEGPNPEQDVLEPHANNADNLTVKATPKAGKAEDDSAAFAFQSADFPRLAGAKEGASSPERKAGVAEWQTNVALDSDLPVS